VKTGDLSAKKDDCQITVIRSGKTQTVSVLTLVVGDVVLLSTVSPPHIYIIYACISAYVCSISLSLSIMKSMAIDGSSSSEMQVP
jgi:hypothetical protein